MQVRSLSAEMFQKILGCERYLLNSVPIEVFKSGEIQKVRIVLDDPKKILHLKPPTTQQQPADEIILDNGDLSLCERLGTIELTENGQNVEAASGCTSLSLSSADISPRLFR